MDRLPPKIQSCGLARLGLRSTLVSTPYLIVSSSIRLTYLGSTTTSGPSLVMQGANVVNMYFDLETNFRYATQPELEAEMRSKVDKAHGMGYDAVKASAIVDASSLLERVPLDLGTSSKGLGRPTN